MKSGCRAAVHLPHDIFPYDRCRRGGPVWPPADTVPHPAQAHARTAGNLPPHFPVSITQTGTARKRGPCFTVSNENALQNRQITVRRGGVALSPHPLRQVVPRRLHSRSPAIPVAGSLGTVAA